MAADRRLGRRRLGAAAPAMQPRLPFLPLVALLAGCATTPANPLPAAGELPLRAHGNEPAWSLVIDGETLRFESDRLHVAGPALPVQIDGERRRYAAALRDRAIPVAVEVAVVPGVCRDGMSGMPYPLRVAATVGERRFAGCGGDPAALLQGSEWAVVELAGDVAVAPSPTLRFGDDGRLAGRASCNAYGATYALTGETLAIGRGMTTRMACPPPQMAQERRFLELLESVRRFDLADDGSLRLGNDAGWAIRARR